MSENKNNSTFIIAGALVVGAVVGAAVASRDDAARVALDRRIDALESQLAEATGGGADEAAAAAQSAADAAASGLATLEARVEALASETGAAIAAAADSSGDAAAETAAAVGDRVSVLAQQMAALVGRVDEIAAGAPAAAPAAEPAAAEPAPAAEAAPQAAATSEGAVSLSVGQTAQIGGSGVFLSRVDAEGGAAQVLIVGSGPAMVGSGAERVTLANGCELVLASAEGRSASFAEACPE